MQVGVPVAGTSASTKKRYSAVAKVGTYATPKTQPFCNNQNDKKRTFSHVPIEAR